MSTSLQRSVSVRELIDRGVPVREYKGPALRGFGAWAGAAATLLVGTAALAAREQLRGRSFNWALAVGVYAIIFLLVGGLIGGRVIALRNIGREDLRQLGFALGGLKRIAALASSGWAGRRSWIGSPVVGVFVSDTALTVVVDSAEIGIVEVDGVRLRGEIARRGGRFWILLSDGREEVALRIWGSRIRD